MLIKRFFALLLVLSLSTGFAWAQAAAEPQRLESGKAVEREIRGGESHSYQLPLAAGQFLRVVVEQKGIDLALTLVGPDARQVKEVNLTGAFGLESLSHEAVVGGDYRIVVRPIGANARKGAYQLRADVKAVATTQDRNRIAAERLLAEAYQLSRPGAAAAQQAIEKAQAVLQQVRELGDRYWEAYVLALIGGAYYVLRSPEKSIEYTEQALAIRRELKDRAGEATSLYFIGLAHFRLNRCEKAIEYYEQALGIQRQVKDRAGEGTTLSGLGNACQNLSRYENAIGYYEQALAIQREMRNRASEAAALTNLGNAYNNLSRYEKAIEYYEQALLIHREIKNRASEALMLMDLGFAYRRLSRYEKAIEYYEQALLIQRELKDRASEGRALSYLGITYDSLGNSERAIEYFEQALVIERAVKDRAGEGITLSSLGNTYRTLGRYEKAIEYYEQALALLREAKDRAEEGIALTFLGNAYVGLGRHEKAVEYFERALTIQREVKNRFWEERALTNLGNAYRNLSRYEKAIEYFERALALQRELKDRSGEAMALTNLGFAYFTLGRFGKAIEYDEQALAVARDIKARGQQTPPLINLGAIYRAQTQYEKATLFHEQALAIARQVKQRDSEAAALNQLMLDWKARDQPRVAIFFGEQSVNTYQEIRSNLSSLDRESQQSFLKSRGAAYRNLAALLIAEARLAEAEQVIRMLKEEEYFEFIGRGLKIAPTSERTGLTPEEQVLENRYREIADHLATLGAEHGSLIDKASRTQEEEQRLAKLEADLVVAGKAFQKFLDELGKELMSSKEASGRILPLRDSQALMEDLRELGKGVVALYTLVGEDKYRVILTTPDFQKGYEYLINAADLNRKVLEFRTVLQDPGHDPLPWAQELYNILLGPLAKDLTAAGAQTLMWSLDGVLRYMPVAALNDGKQYLVERYQNVVFTPASQARLKDAPSRTWDALGLGVTKSHGERIPALPGVLDEMRGIIRDESANPSAAGGKPLGVLPGVVKLDEQFTEDAMLAELRKRHKVVHIASHFQFSPGDETNSALLLGDGKFLNLAQIKSLPNVFGGVELLTLSACNTATGGTGADGKEVEGFGVLAQRQGAKAVIATLWPVSDTSTKILMQDFYRIRESKADTTKAEALRQAQLRLLRGETAAEGATAKTTADRKIVHEEGKPGTANKALFMADPKKPFAHPYYWAPFILIGNWK